MEDADIAARVKRSVSSYRYDHPFADVVGRRGSSRVSRRSRVILGLAFAAAIGFWGLNATAFVGRPSDAFAGWQAVPTLSDSALAAAAQPICLAGSPSPEMKLVAQDQRGKAATFVFVGNGQLILCLVTRDETGSVVSAAAGQTLLESRTTPITVDTGLSAPKGVGSDGIQIIAGRIDPSVSAVRIARADGLVVEATVTAGYFVAWWPSDTKADAITALNGSGKPISTVPGLP